MSKEYDVIGLGNALMDFLVEINDQHFLEFNLKKGEMHLIEEKQAKEILTKLQKSNFNIETVPGGSSANTLKGLALLGSKVIFCGKVGNDEQGLIYEQQMINHQVNPRLSKHSKLTGQAFTFITPDSERTFSVHLGAAIELHKNDIMEEDIKNSKILHLEGYQLEGQTKETILHALQLAKKHHTLISLDLADPGLIRRNHQQLKEIVKNYVDIVFMNEKEAKEFTGLEEEQALQKIKTKIAIVKLGERGSLISHNNQITKIKPYPAKVMDTTGAGDTFAAGFLYGYCQGWDIEKSGKLGSLMAAKIVEQKGVKLNQLNIEEIKKELSSGFGIS